MWGNSKKSRMAKIETLVGHNTEITGDVVFRGGMHVDGVVRGNIIAEGENCVLSLSQQGVVEGDVKVPHIVLDGTVTGDVFSLERLELAPHTRVNGDVYYNLLEMAVGASVNGKLVHKPAEQPLLLEKGQAEQAAEASDDGAEDEPSQSEAEDPDFRHQANSQASNG